MFQAIPYLAAMSWVLANLCGMVGSPRVFRVRSAEPIMPKQTKIWLCEGKTLYQLGMSGKMAPVLEPQNCLSKIVLGGQAQQGGASRGWVGGSPVGGSAGQAGEKRKELPLPQSHTIQSVSFCLSVASLANLCL